MQTTKMNSLQESAELPLEEEGNSIDENQDVPVQSSAGIGTGQTGSSVRGITDTFQNGNREPSGTAKPAASGSNANTVEFEDLETAPVENPFLEMKFEEFRILAKAINCNSVFVSKLRDRLIDADTIPMSFMRKLAEELDFPLTKLKEHLYSNDPVYAPEQYYCFCDGRPSVIRKNTYEEAVLSSDLNEEQQKYLLSFLEAANQFDGL